MQSGALVLALWGTNRKTCFGQVLHSNKWWPTNHCSREEVLQWMWNRTWYFSSYQYIHESNSIKYQWLSCGPRLTLWTFIKSSNSWKKVTTRLRQWNKLPKKPGLILKTKIIPSSISLDIHQRDMLCFEVSITIILTWQLLANCVGQTWISLELIVMSWLKKQQLHCLVKNYNSYFFQHSKIMLKYVWDMGLKGERTTID